MVPKCFPPADRAPYECPSLAGSASVDCANFHFQNQGGAPMPIPDFQTLMLPVLRLAAEGEIRVSDAVDRLASDFRLSPED